MLVGLLSDTHVAFPYESLPHQILSAFRGVDFILHAGDIWIPSVLDELESIAPVKAAWGDDDMEADLGEDSRMMKGRTLHLDGITLWLSHVKPRYALINPQEKVYPSSRSNEVLEDPPDVVIYGHTHFGVIEHYKGVIIMNPGSATLPGYIPKLGTVGLLTVDSGEVEAKLVQLG